MEKNTLLAKPIKVAPKLTKSSKLYKTIIKAIQDKKGEDIISIDLRKTQEAVSDFFIICTATSSPQCKAIADNIEHEVEKNCLEKVFKKEGYQSVQWILLDYINIVIHIMQPASRSFYKIEDMWSDADISKIEI